MINVGIGNLDLRTFIPVAVSMLAAMAADAFVFSGEDLALCLSLDLMAASLVWTLMFHRATSDIVREILPVSATVLLVLSLFPFRCLDAPLKIYLCPIMSSLLVLCEKTVLDYRRYRTVNRLFRNDAVWHRVLDDMRGFHGAVTLSLMSAVHLVRALPHGVSVSLSAAIFLASVALAVLSTVRLLSDRTLYMSPDKEDELKSLLKGSLRTKELAEGVRDRKMKALYRRLLECFESEKPYLDEDLNLEDLSHRLYTNKSYLSKTVNVLSGKNFRQFVNYYRVEYSTELVRRDPHLKVEELAMMSGFHTAVSYNMAFRLFKGETPSEWIHRYRATLKRGDQTTGMQHQ